MCSHVITSPIPVYLTDIHNMNSFERATGLHTVFRPSRAVSSHVVQAKNDTQMNWS